MNEEISSRSELSHLSDLSIGIENILLRTLKAAEGLLDSPTLDKLRLQLENLTNCDSIVNSVESFLLSLILKIEQLYQSATIDVNRQDYQTLEAAVQKSEAEIRNHIRLEQQLKIHLENLEDRIEELEKQLSCESRKYHQLFESAKALDIEKRELRKKIKFLQSRPKQSHDMSEPVRIRHKASKLLTEPSFHNESTSSAFKMYQEKRATRSRNFSYKSGDNRISLGSKRKDSKQNLQASLESSPKKKGSHQEQAHGGLDRLESELSKTIQLKQQKKINSRKLLMYESSYQTKNKREARSSSVCN